MTTELVLLGTAGHPCLSPAAFADAGPDFRRLEAVFITHLHADHTGDLAGLLLYPWASA